MDAAAVCCERLQSQSFIAERMSNNDEYDEIVTGFLLETCLQPPRLSERVFEAVEHCAVVITGGDAANTDASATPLITGSVAEFYIEPMLPHIGDIDIMFHRNSPLAIPRGHRPPTQLPDEFDIFDNCVIVCEIIDSSNPGYVYLEIRYLLTESSDDGNYNAVEYDTGQYLSKNFYRNTYNRPAHGPALFLAIPGMTELPIDLVHCIRCLVWPKQAADWPKRHRDYGWPDSATVDRVVNNGCDVVGVAHRQCRRYELLDMLQHRLSFSRAEIVLINGWVPVQQIVYHMLRYFVKTERLTDCADNSGAGTLSNYHIKTLMLWACELKSRSWWTDDVNLVRMCVQLLHNLAEWLTYSRCQHYFINDCNLIDESFNVTYVRDQLMSVDNKWLSTWFIGNYIRKCSQRTPYHILRLFDDVSTSMKLQNAVLEIVYWRRNNSLLNLSEILHLVHKRITRIVYKLSLTTRSCVYWMTELAKIDSSLSVYFTAVAFLHIACKSSTHDLSDRLTDILATLCGQFICKRLCSNNFASLLSLGKAVDLMKVVTNKSFSTMSLVEIELSKAYLYRALRCKDSDSDSIYCLANVYLAVLYYTTGQYQTAIDHCTLVTRSQDHSQCSSHVVQGEILPKIDNDVDNMLGLAELYQSVRTATLKQKQQPQLVSVFTTELFAYYLHIKYLSLTKSRQFMQTSSTDELSRYGLCISDTQQPFIGDALLFLSVSRLCKFRHKPICPKPLLTLMNANEYNTGTSDLVELLQKSAVEHLTTFRQLTARDFGSVATVVTTDFEALYAYKRGDYQRCLQWSTQNVNALLGARRGHEIPTYPEFIQLLDDDIVSLTALALIINPACRDYNHGVYITSLTLSLYLMTQCQLKLRHSTTSLAQTFDYIKVAQIRQSPERILDQLSLKLTERKILANLTYYTKKRLVDKWRMDNVVIVRV